MYWQANNYLDEYSVYQANPAIKVRNRIIQGRRIKLRCPPKVLTGTLHPSLPSIFSG